jgi:NAD(P)H dehydrogenase (quinone)
MSDVNVLVVFYSRLGTTEKLALAAGLGAIQAKANIRLRRLVDLADRATIEANPSWLENLDRMNRDYVAPRPADPGWADVIILASPRQSSGEIEQYCGVLAGDSMTGKIAAPLAAGDADATLTPIYAAAACAGFVVAPSAKNAEDPLSAARMFGQRVTQMARSLKQK